MATATFINEGNCLVSRDWAIRVNENKNYYVVQTPFFSGKNEYGIDSTLYKDADDDVAAFWGVLKVSYKI